MTTSELKEKIAASVDPDFYNNLDLTFTFRHIDQSFTLIGLSAIYEYILQQIEGWLAKENLPNEFKKSIEYFEYIQKHIMNLTSNFDKENQLNSRKWYDIKQYIKDSNHFPFPYDSLEAIFLLELHHKKPNSFQGAFRYIISNIEYSLLSNKDTLSGTLLAYEFSMQNSNIAKGRELEEFSIQDLKLDFKKYISESEKHFSNYLKQAKDKYDDYSNAIDTTKAEKEKTFNDWFNTSKNDFSKFDGDSKEKITELEKAYEELLRLKKPTEYWNKRALELKSQGWISLRWLIGLVLLSCFALYSLLWLTPAGMLATFFADDKSLAIKWSIIFVTFISFMFFGIRVLAKVSFSSFHLARDAEEREQLTHVYLAMIKEANLEKEDRLLVMQSLFSRAETGLLKDDSSPAMPGIGSILEKVK